MARMILDIISSPNRAGLRPAAARPCRGSLPRRVVRVRVQPNPWTRRCGDGLEEPALVGEAQQGRDRVRSNSYKAKALSHPALPGELGTASGRPLSPEEGPRRGGGGSWRAAEVYGHKAGAGFIAPPQRLGSPQAVRSQR